MMWVTKIVVPVTLLFSWVTFGCSPAPQTPVPAFQTLERVLIPRPLPPATRTPNRPPPVFIPGPTEKSPEPYIPPPSPTPLPPLPAEKREGLWAENLEIGGPQALTTEIKDVEEFALSPDGKYLAVSYRNGQTFFEEETGATYFRLSIVLIDVASKQIMPLVESGNSPRWSPDGKLIAYTFPDYTDGRALIRIINVETRTITDVASWGSGDIRGEFDWLSAHELAYYINQPLLYDTENQETIRLFDPNLLSLTDRSLPITAIAVAQLGDFIAYGSREQILVFRRQNSKMNLVRRIDDGLDHNNIAISPDGKFLAYARWNSSQVAVKDLLTEDEPIELPWIHRFPDVRTWAPDSTSFFFAGFPGDGVTIVNRDGTGLQNLSAIRAVKAPVWSPQGDRIYWIDTDGNLMSSIVIQK